MSALVLSMLRRSIEAMDAETSVDNAISASEETANATAALDVGRLTRAFINMRAAREKLAAEYKKQDEALRAKQKIIEAAMLNFLNVTGQKSAPTDAGTFYKQEEITPTGADWDKFYAWVAENNTFDFLERRIKKTAVKEYMDDHDGGVPPGVSVFREYKIVVRRS